MDTETTHNGAKKMTQTALFSRTRTDNETAKAMADALQAQIDARRDLAYRAAMAGASIGPELRATQDQEVKATCINTYIGPVGDGGREELRAVLFDAFHVNPDYMPRRR